MLSLQTTPPAAVRFPHAGASAMLGIGERNGAEERLVGSSRFPGAADMAGEMRGGNAGQPDLLGFSDQRRRPSLRRSALDLADSTNGGAHGKMACRR